MSKHRRAIRFTAKEKRKAKLIPPAYTFSYNYNPTWSDAAPLFMMGTGATATNTTNLNPSHYTIQYNGNSYTLSLDPNTDNLVY